MAKSCLSVLLFARLLLTRTCRALADWPRSAGPVVPNKVTAAGAYGVGHSDRTDMLFTGCRNGFH